MSGRPYLTLTPAPPRLAIVRDVTEASDVSRALPAELDRSGDGRGVVIPLRRQIAVDPGYDAPPADVPLPAPAPAPVRLRLLDGGVPPMATPAGRPAGIPALVLVPPLPPEPEPEDGEGGEIGLAEFLRRGRLVLAEVRQGDGVPVPGR